MVYLLLFILGVAAGVTAGYFWGAKAKAVVQAVETGAQGVDSAFKK